MRYIYGLRCPKENRIMYVGQTRRPGQRFISHISPSSISNVKRSVWIESLLPMRPDLVILEKCFDYNAIDREVYWINLFGLDNLFNRAVRSSDSFVSYRHKGYELRD